MKIYLSLLSAILLFIFIKIFSQSANVHEVSFNASKAVKLSSVIKSQRDRSPASPLGLDVVIEHGQIAYLDEDTNIDTLTIHGELHCDEEVAPDII
jgi:hypothetical protein